MTGIRYRPGRSQVAEVRAAIVVAVALAVASAVITLQAAIALATGSHPGTSGVTLAPGRFAGCPDTPAYAKRRLGAQMASRACKETAPSAASARPPAC